MRFICFAMLVAAGLSTSADRVALAAETIGSVAKVQAEADAYQAADKRSLASSSPVFLEDRLQTGPGARLLANLDDGTALTLGENGELTIDDFVYTPKKRGNSLVLNVKGAFLFVGGKIEEAGGGAVEINTPVGTLGVRGTTVWGGQVDDGYGILVLDGLVTVRTGGRTITLKKGQGTMIRNAQAPDRAAAWPTGRTERAVAMISFAPTP